jgi:hypothetical protein
MLLSCYDKGPWDWLDVYHVREEERCVLNFSGKTLKEESNWYAWA